MTLNEFCIRVEQQQYSERKGKETCIIKIFRTEIVKVRKARTWEQDEEEEEKKEEEEEEKERVEIGRGGGKRGRVGR